MAAGGRCAAETVARDPSRFDHVPVLPLLLKPTKPPQYHTTSHLILPTQAGQNPMYTFRESIDLGLTSKSMIEIRSIIQTLKQEWPGGCDVYISVLSTCDKAQAV